MVKVLLVMLIVGTSTLIGFYKKIELNAYEKKLEDFRQLILKIETQISYFKEPLPEIFLKLSEKEKGEAAKLSIFLHEKCIGENENLKEIWNEAIDFVYEKNALKSPHREIFQRAGGFLGQSDFEGQKSHFVLLEDELAREIKKAKEESMKKGNMYVKMSISFGIILGILVI